MCQATFAITEIEFVPGPFRCQIELGHLRPTPASFRSVFLSGIRKRKNVFQVTQYKTFQILVQTFPEPWSSGSQSVFHLRNRQRFQVPGFEWVHELLLFCLASNPAQFCAEISCGKTELEHNCTISISTTAKSKCPSSIWQRKGPSPKSISVIAKGVWYKINFSGLQLYRNESELIRIPGF